MIQILTHPDLQLDEEHVYRVGGRQFPSVTQILQATGLADFSDIPEYMREFALERGRKTHVAVQWWLEKSLRGVRMEKGVVVADEKDNVLSEDTIGCLESLNKFLFHSEFQVDTDDLERRVLHPQHGFAGTFDAVGRFPEMGLALGDWKRGMMSGVEYQTGAYLLCVPRVFHRFSLKLRPDGKMAQPHFYPVKDLLSDQRRFLDALAALRKKEALENEHIYR